MSTNSETLLAARADQSNGGGSSGVQAGKGQITEFYGSARDKVQGAWGSVRQEVTANPFVAAAGAVAVGAGIGWLLPSGRREKQVLAEVAHKVTDAARDAANTAVEAGRQQVDDLTHNALASVGGAMLGAVVSNHDQPRGE